MSSPVQSGPDRVTAVWNALLTAELNVRYWTLLSNRYARRDRRLKITIALTALSNVFAAFTFWKLYPGVWQSIAVISGVAAWAHPFVCDSQVMKQVNETVAVWKEIQANYQVLWLFDAGLLKEKSVEQFQENMLREAKIDDSKLREDEKLIEQAYKYVLEKRGLNGR